MKKIFYILLALPIPLLVYLNYTLQTWYKCISFTTPNVVGFSGSGNPYLPCDLPQLGKLTTQDVNGYAFLFYTILFFIFAYFFKKKNLPYKTIMFFGVSLLLLVVFFFISFVCFYQVFINRVFFKSFSPHAI